MNATAPQTEKVDPNYDPLNNFDDVVDPKQNLGLIATFYKFAEQNNFRSGQEKRPIFDEKVFVRIERVGDKLSVNEREATEFDKARFAAEYEAFLRGDTQIQGIPIETLPGLSVSRIAELKAVKVHTIEGLATVPDSSLRYIGMDGQTMRAKAQSFLDAMKASAGEQAIAEVQAHSEAAGGRLDAVEGAVANLGEQMSSLTGLLQQVLTNQATALNVAQPEKPPEPETEKTVKAAKKDESHDGKDIV